MFAMEMESLHPGSTTVRARQQPKQQHQFFSQLWMLIKLRMESSPKIFSTIGLIALAFFMYIAVEWSKPPLARHEVKADYSNIQLDYDFKATQIDHWCLFGDDSACTCDDFSEPVPREEIKGWMEAHNANKKRYKAGGDYDIVFLGDDLIEELNGTWLNITAPAGVEIKENFIKTFGGENEDKEQMEALALGIAGDSSSNLLWRIEHGELPDNIVSKVFWISIGSNDLAKGGCSEEATMLGILHVAEEVAVRNPYARVVIQGILPRSLDGSGFLVPHTVPTSSKIFGSKHTESYYSEEARKNLQLWPSIQNVNQQLWEFCKNHETIIYVDVNALFVGSVSNAIYRSKSVQIVSELMPRYDGRLSVLGHDRLNSVIIKELVNIIRENDDANDVVDQNGVDVIDEETGEIESGP
ncbi:hypothetical protein ACA910_018511 [Epithemia clementina (nom. ined.)]